jgi:iron complex outermembrane receptor protein
LNGIAYNDAESQGVFLVNLPDLLSSTNSIQVQRGVGTSSNGTGAFGATVNLLTNDIQEHAYGELNNSFGSFQTRKHTLKAGTGLINKHFTVDFRLSSINSNGFIERATSDLQSFYVSAAHIGETSSLRLNVFSGKEKTYQAWYGVSEEDLAKNRRLNIAGTEKPGSPYENETDNYRQTHYQLFYNRKLGKKWDLSAVGFATTGLGYYEQYKAEESFSKYGLGKPLINGIAITETDLIRQLWLDNIYRGTNISLQKKSENREIILGGGASAYDGKHYGKIIWAQTFIEKDYKWYDLKSDKNEQYAFIKWLEKSGNLKWFGDLQVRSVNYATTGFRDNPKLPINQQWFFVNPKVGVRYTKNKFSSFLSYAVANKEPNRDDFEAGQSQLPKPETLHDFEAGMEIAIGKSTFNTTVYHMQYKNQLVLNGKINDVGAYTRTNVPNSSRSGIEVEVNIPFSNKLVFNNNIALSRSNIKSYTEYYDDYDAGGQVATTYTGTPISFSPNLVNNASLSYRPIDILEIKWITKNVSRQYLDNTGRLDRSLDGFMTQDLNVFLSPSLKNLKNCTFFVQVFNLFDVKYAPNGYTYSYKYGGDVYRNNFYYPMAGRNFMLGLNLGF